MQLLHHLPGLSPITNLSRVKQLRVPGKLTVDVRRAQNPTHCWALLTDGREMPDHVPHKTLKDAKASWAVWRGSCVTRGVCTIPAALEKRKSKRPADQCIPVPKPTPPPAAPGPAAASRAGVTPQPGCSVKHGAVPSPGAEEPLQRPPPAPSGHGSAGPGSPHKPPACAAAPCAGPPAPVFPASPPAASPPRRGLAHLPSQRPGPAPVRRSRGSAAPASLGCGGHRLLPGPGPPPLPARPAQHRPAAGGAGAAPPGRPLCSGGALWPSRRGLHGAGASRRSRPRSS